MLRLIPSSLDTIDVELDIMNSNPFYNLLSKDKEELSPADMQADLIEAQAIGAERFIIQTGDQPIGILEFLMKNPNDGYPWLGLLIVKKEYQGQECGSRSLNAFIRIMTERQVNVFRIGVIRENEPAHRFWKRQGFIEVTIKRTKDNKEVTIYEKHI